MNSITRCNPFILKTISQIQKNFNMINQSTMNRDKINILFCDIQDKYMKKIANCEELLQKARVIAEISKISKFNQVISTQKKEVFGKTVEEIEQNLLENAKVFEKNSFAMFSEEEIENMAEDEVHILLGIEAHVCVYQTALNFIRKNRHIVILSDAISSSNMGERKVALENLRDLGCYVTTCQSLVFLMLQDANNPFFKSYVTVMKNLSAISCNLLLDKGNAKY